MQETRISGQILTHESVIKPNIYNDIFLGYSTLSATCVKQSDSLSAAITVYHYHII